MEEILKNWDIGGIRLIEPLASYWGKTARITTVDGRQFILKEKPDLSRMQQESNLLSILSLVDAPVAVPVRTVTNAWHTLSDGKIFSLYPRLPGEIIAEHFAGDAAGRAGMFGKAIGLLHTCFLKCNDLNGYPDLRLMDQIRDWAIPCIREHKTILDADSIETIWGGVEKEMGSLYNQLPRQLIHRDLHPANMLFDGDRLTGFVDFEMVVRSPRIFDVCYCGTSLLVSAYPDADKMQSWPGLFRCLVKGYQELCPLVPSEILALYGMLAAIELLFAAFSLETGAQGAARCNAGVLQWLSTNRELLTG